MNGVEQRSGRAALAFGVIGSMMLVAFAAGASRGSGDAAYAAGPTVGLVAYYAFEETSGTQALDSSGNANHAAMNGTLTRGAGKVGSALYFDGTSTYGTAVATPSIDSMRPTMGFSVWVKQDVNPIGAAVFSRQRETWHDIYSLYTASGNWGFELKNATADQWIIGGSQKVGVWSHLAGSYDGSTFRLYQDGTQANMATTSGLIDAVVGPLIIGAENNSGTSFIPQQFFKGWIDELRLYNVPLTVADINDLRNDTVGAVTTTIPETTTTATTIAPTTTVPQVTTTLPNPTTVVPTTAPPATLPQALALYRCNEGTGSVLLDSSGRGLNGTKFGAAPLVAGRFSRGCGMNGSTQYAVSSTQASLNSTTGTHGISLWVKPNRADQTDGVVIARAPSGTPADTLEVRAVRMPNGTYGYAFTVNTLGGSLTTYGGAQTVGVWLHIAFSYNGSTPAIHLNGAALAAPGTLTGTPGPSSTPLTIGARVVDGVPSGFFDGIIDEVRYYDIAFSSAQIALLRRNVV